MRFACLSGRPRYDYPIIVNLILPVKSEREVSVEDAVQVARVTAVRRACQTARVTRVISAFLGGGRGEVFRARHVASRIGLFIDSTLKFNVGKFFICIRIDQCLNYTVSNAYSPSSAGPKSRGNFGKQSLENLLPYVAGHLVLHTIFQVVKSLRDLADNRKFLELCF